MSKDTFDPHVRMPLIHLLNFLSVMYDCVAKIVVLCALSLHNTVVMTAWGPDVIRVGYSLATFACPLPRSTQFLIMY